ncbi:HNH endonuclease family protein [Actinokineospora pegani]|uniref:HNH endonuclease family protein n=1 Tax=Actinokineospora pegani TaxID=2654637 RepID=UPI001F322208|nr:HNH endonuclease family protein [Actinokineospora pegani]
MAQRAKSKQTRWLSALLAVIVLAATILWSTWGADEPAGVDAQQARDQLARLVVAEEDTGNPYDRDDWPHWSAQGESCDTREEALKRQGAEVRTGAACKVESGSWTSLYDGVTITNAREADLDHVVPLAEANRSGTRHWTREQRKAFANDLDQLLVVSARSNRQKGDQDPAKWLPDASHSCEYAVKWVAVKSKYELTVDRAERETLDSLLARCPR